MYGYPFGDESSAIDNLYDEYIIVLDENNRDVDTGVKYTATDCSAFHNDKCDCCGVAWDTLYVSEDGRLHYCDDCTGHVPDYE